MRDIWLQRGKFRRKTKKPYKYKGYLASHEYNMSLEHLKKLESIKVYKNVRVMSRIRFLDHRSKVLS